MGYTTGGSENQPWRKDEPSDEVVEDFIHRHPNGASCDAIGEVLGVCSVRVRQILKSAITKCQRVCARREITVEDLPKQHETVWDRIASS